MKVVVIESETYKRLVQKINQIYYYIKMQTKENATLQTDPSEIWLNDQDATAMLQVSKRTMQRLRSNGKITYSIRGGKVWYTQAEVERLLSGRVMNNDKMEGGEL